MTDSIRINRWLAQNGFATRREADALIEKGLVLLNGRPARLGDQVGVSDTVEVRASKKHANAERRYYAYNKPRGVITHSPGEDETSINDVLPDLAVEGIFPVGRLDKDSHGLIILTNDGRITDRLLNPDHDHDKEYVVRTKLPLRDSFKKHMEAGVDIEGYLTKPAKVRVTGEHTFSIAVTEGKKHQIRRMVVAMHNEVTDLKRSRILNIKLGTLKAGEARPIEGAERDAFLTSLGLLNAPH